MTTRRTDTSTAQQAYEVDAGSTISASSSPIIAPRVSPTEQITELSLDKVESPALRRNASTRSNSFRVDLFPDIPLTTFHYARRHWRVP